MGQEEYPSIDMARFGRKLREACGRNRVTASDLQKFLHLGSVQAVYMWFEGKRLPNLDNLYALSKYLDISMEELLGEASADGDGARRDDERLGHQAQDDSDYGKRLLFYWRNLREEK